MTNRSKTEFRGFSGWFGHPSGLLGACACAALLAFSAGPARADFDLEPGDQVTVSLTGLADLSIDATIDAHGNVNLQWLGEFPAQGQSLDRLEQMVRQEAAGKIVKQYDTNGEIYIIQLDGDEIEITRNGYRPIIIGGDVARTGQIDFRPTITAREAVALAGGVRSRLLADDVTIDPIQLLRWQTAYGQAALQHAHGLAQIWRASTEILQDEDLPPPAPHQVKVSAKVLTELIEEQIKIRKINQENEAGERAFFEDAAEQATERESILEEQKFELGKALAADEEEEARVISLTERGLTAGSRLADTRRTTVLSATRLLEVEEDLAATGLVLTRLKRDREQYEQERTLRLLQERRAAGLEVRDASVQMDTISKYLAGASSEIGTEDLITDIDYEVTIYRVVDGQLQALPAEKLTRLLPGDSLDIAVQEVAGDVPLTE
ncbi:polysaccharide biosynthesis/export family protein [Ruegeria sp. R14_0]|uniref:polysaccharide biosynthesis/export family protein n=1 Tax=Ruegeria sp. R14_0 TaxID=2821100 RepID=UPI001ADA3532|nr:polysaccharide biosynthesis/export family protein [Ruegeria sp. R14_0]MBO9445918.1 polysaccharide biosynthesis/export family protein [Ruegeria sp. R14_0]